MAAQRLWCPNRIGVGFILCNLCLAIATAKVRLDKPLRGIIMDI
jgi:hypothetical protein